MDNPEKPQHVQIPPVPPDKQRGYKNEKKTKFKPSDLAFPPQQQNTLGRENWTKGADRK